MMKIKAVVCDIDGTLLPPDCGVVVNKKVETALINLQKQGMMIILASARIFQGVLPIAKQIQMDRYGGYIISSNGAYAYDVVQDKVVFMHEIKKDDALAMQHKFLNAGLDFAIAQPDKMIATNFSIGFQLDHDNCDIDYLITHDSQNFLQEEISKCSASQKSEVIDLAFASLKTDIEKQYPYMVLRSTPYFVDIIEKGCGKMQALAQLLPSLSLSFDDIAAIGDGDSDAKMLEYSAFSATLENGTM